MILSWIAQHCCNINYGSCPLLLWLSFAIVESCCRYFTNLHIFLPLPVQIPCGIQQMDWLPFCLSFHFLCVFSIALLGHCSDTTLIVWLLPTFGRLGLFNLSHALPKDWQNSFLKASWGCGCFVTASPSWRKSKEHKYAKNKRQKLLTTPSKRDVEMSLGSNITLTHIFLPPLLSPSEAVNKEDSPRESKSETVFTVELMWSAATCK